jgi:hypothetical protein
MRKGYRKRESAEDRLGNEGYAFANVNALPDINRDKQQVGFTFFVDPGRKTYVRRVNIAGNTKTMVTKWCAVNCASWKARFTTLPT